MIHFGFFDSLGSFEYHVNQFKKLHSLKIKLDILPMTLSWTD